MERNAFSSWCSSAVRLLDGATGTNLIKAGMPQRVCQEQWILDHPDTIIRLLRTYRLAGSEIVYAPSFGANRVLLRRHRMEQDVRRLSRELALLSREAVGPGVYVAGDLTTTGEFTDPEDEDEYAELLDVYREQAEALLEGGVDLFAVETMMSLTQCRAAVEAIRSVCSLPVICTVTVQPDGRCLFGGSAAELASKLPALGADAVGINCSFGPEGMLPLIREMRTLCSVPIVAKPNAGLPQTASDGTVSYSMQPSDFCRHVRSLIDAGAGLIGGCCGTEPEHIRALTALRQK